MTNRGTKRKNLSESDERANPASRPRVSTKLANPSSVTYKFDRDGFSVTRTDVGEHAAAADNDSRQGNWTTFGPGWQQISGEASGDLIRQHLEMVESVHPGVKYQFVLLPVPVIGTKKQIMAPHDDKDQNLTVAPLRPPPTRPSNNDRITAKVLYDFTGTGKPELSVTKDQTVEIMLPSDDDSGWAKVRTLEGQEGGVPAGFLEKMNPPAAKDSNMTAVRNNTPESPSNSPSSMAYRSPLSSAPLVEDDLIIEAPIAEAPAARPKPAKSPTNEPSTTSHHTVAGPSATARVRPLREAAKKRRYLATGASVYKNPSLSDLGIPRAESIALSTAHNHRQSDAEPESLAIQSLPSDSAPVAAVQTSAREPLAQGIFVPISGGSDTPLPRLPATQPQAHTGHLLSPSPMRIRRIRSRFGWWKNDLPYITEVRSKGT
ncbi:hypothetical protein QBC35DRAFT_536117 [Podospora australis]|uniref:SH3 domain-containing protein n=1 Tax=Podospora australis TaxID=1536484 RepID=A0AAN6WKI6_9PEZI|nr:hypothetical protein QBC35DRAFT_536117 [Podospora australis]